jgi:Flp pilus assembly protein CpaB
MRRGRIIFLLVLIVGLGLVLVWFFFNQLGQPAAVQTTQQATSFTEIYYAQQNIPQGTKITAEMLGKLSVPPEKVAEFEFTVGEEGNLIDQIARYNLDQGVVITSAMVGTGPVEIAGPAWAIQIPSGMVAATIPANRLSLAGYAINDGAHVNVTACMLFVDVDPAFQTQLPNFTSVLTGTGFVPDELPVLSVASTTTEGASRQGRVELDPTLQQPFYAIPSEAQRPRLVCQMILQNVVVMKLGNFTLQAPVATDPNVTPSAAQVQQQSSPDIVTLMVNPQDSISLNYFVYSGAMLSMSLRNPNDTARFDAQSTTLTSLLTQYNISLPTKLPYTMHPRLDVLVAPLLPNDVVTVQPQQ